MAMRSHLAEMNHFQSKKKKRKGEKYACGVPAKLNDILYVECRHACDAVLLVMSDDHVNMFIFPGEGLLSVEIVDARCKAENAGSDLFRGCAFLK